MTSHKRADRMKIAVFPGDGIGVEVIGEAVKVLNAALGSSYEYELVKGLIGGAAMAACGEALPDRTIAIAEEADAILLGGCGLPGDETMSSDVSATGALLKLRKRLNLFANYRPVKPHRALIGASTLKPEIVRDLDLVVVRETSSGLYFGLPRGISALPGGERAGTNTLTYSESEVERIARAGFELARRRTGKLTSVDKANVLESMVLWRDVVSQVSREYPDVALSHLYVDAAAMELLRDPKQFDVMVTENLFGDILSDAAAMLTGSIGMLPSATMTYGRKGLFEPVHGTAPDIAGRNVANPVAAILSAAMMLRMSFGLEEEARRIEQAVDKVLDSGLRTQDIFTPEGELVGTTQMGDAVVAALV